MRLNRRGDCTGQFNSAGITAYLPYFSHVRGWGHSRAAENSNFRLVDSELSWHLVIALGGRPRSVCRDQQGEALAFQVRAVAVSVMGMGPFRARCSRLAGVPYRDRSIWLQTYDLDLNEGDAAKVCKLDVEKVS